MELGLSLRPRAHAELLQQTELIQLRSCFADLTVRQAINGNPLHSNLFASRWDALKQAGVGGLHGPACYDFVTFGNQVLNRKSHIREAAQQAQAALFLRFTSNRGRPPRIIESRIAREELIRRVELTLANRLECVLQISADDQFVVFRCHFLNSLLSV